MKAAARGLTLVELLVAVAILSAVIGTMASSFYGSVRAWRSVERRLDLAQSGRTALAQISRELGSVWIGGGRPGAEFLGDQQRLLFTAALEPSSWDSTPEYDLKRVGYFVGGSRWQDGDSLWRWESRFPYSEAWADVGLDEMEGISGGEELAEGVVEVFFAYFDGQEWWDSWGSDPGLADGEELLVPTSQQQDLPVAVYVSVVITESGEGGREEAFTTTARLQLARPTAEPVEMPEMVEPGAVPGAML